MREKLGRKARRLKLYRSSFAHYITTLRRSQEGDSGCLECCKPIKLTAKAQATCVQVHVKPDEFGQLLWGVQGWRRPH